MREPIPIACTLLPDAKANRLDEFRRLFAENLQAIDRPGPTSLRLTLAASPGVEARTGEHIALEQQCCAFFTFEVISADGYLVVNAEVPEGAEAALDELAEIARQALNGES